MAAEEPDETPPPVLAASARPAPPGSYVRQATSGRRQPRP